MCHLSKGPGGGLGKRAPQSLREFIPTLNPPSLPHFHSLSPPPPFTLLLVFSPRRPPLNHRLHPLHFAWCQKKSPVMFSVFPVVTHSCGVCLYLCAVVFRVTPCAVTFYTLKRSCFFVLFCSNLFFFLELDFYFST